MISVISDLTFNSSSNKAVKRPKAVDVSSFQKLKRNGIGRKSSKYLNKFPRIYKMHSKRKIVFLPCGWYWNLLDYSLHLLNFSVPHQMWHLQEELQRWGTPCKALYKHCEKKKNTLSYEHPLNKKHWNETLSLLLDEDFLILKICWFLWSSFWSC